VQGTPTVIVSSNIKDNLGNVLIKKVSLVFVEFQNKRRKVVGKPGEINLLLKSTNSVDGQIILLSGNYMVAGENLRGKVLGIGIGVGVLLVWPMLFYLLKKGGEAELPSNTMILGSIVSDYKIAF